VFVYKPGKKYANRNQLLQQHQLNGYLKVCLITKQGKYKNRYVHNLVAEEFIEKPLSTEPLQINHINSKRDENNVENFGMAEHQC